MKNRQIKIAICDALEGDVEVLSCVDCGEALSKTEIINEEDTCYPCQKGNR